MDGPIRFEDSQTYGERMKIARVYRGMTQQDMAEKLDVITQNYSRWEQERNYPLRPYRTLIAEALDFPEDDLFPEKD